MKLCKQIVLLQVQSGSDESGSHLVRVINSKMILENIQAGKVSRYFCVSNVIWNSGQPIPHQTCWVNLFAKITESPYASIGLVRAATRM